MIWKQRGLPRGLLHRCGKAKPNAVAPSFQPSPTGSAQIDHGGGGELKFLQTLGSLSVGARARFYAKFAKLFSGMENSMPTKRARSRDGDNLGLPPLDTGDAELPPLNAGDVGLPLLDAGNVGLLPLDINALGLRSLGNGDTALPALDPNKPK